ncbi:cAMP dependent protein kinase regulatory subunit [Kockovaella imperatae]|uniref:cAMP-dependent protein kinase regulatory subunit n=1 Tax=Kockovaella imperatae TaxID=4999 RepID=A0A1Y1UEL1_9TREE|nr:cAMP dependent protein kinase regulatory subunit [Kockovaella imperatae]ORX36483.1 cAMP dependent protein kinase regulatory subunit [Kockovaella imperatae]
MPRQSWQEILSDLNRDLARDSPSDVLQWGADWFQAQLKRDRMSANSDSPMTGNQRFPPTGLGGLSAIPPNMQHHLYPHGAPSPFSEHFPQDSPFAPRRATEPTPISSRNGAPMFASPFGGGAAIPPAGEMPVGANLGPRSSISAPDEPPIPAYALGRRTSVSAESLVPTNRRAFSVSAGGLEVLAEDEGPGATSMPHYPKSEEQLARIRNAIKPNFLFRNLDEEQEADVLGAMKEVQVPAGDLVIEQGAAGDFFYVVERGVLDVYVKRDGQVLDQDKGDHQKLGKKVAECKEGSSFGELALMHNAPRAASILSLTPCTLWALDRVSFRTILLDHTSRKRRLYEIFLSEVPILATLQPQERAKIADVLESRTYADGEDVIVAGEAGEEFFLVESGEAVALKSDESGQPQVVKQYGKGDYFGELALLNRQARAATVRAQGKLRVAALGEQAFTRLLGPVKDIMARSVGEMYGYTAAR